MFWELSFFQYSSPKMDSIINNGNNNDDNDNNSNKLFSVHLKI